MRRLRLFDSESVYRMLRDADTALWADLPRMKQEGDAAGFIYWGNHSGEVDQYGLFSKEYGEFLGILQVMLPKVTGTPSVRELGYVMTHEARGKGYMSEAVKAVCEDVFSDPSVNEVVLDILPSNAPSLGVAGRCGFSFLQQDPREKMTSNRGGEPMDRYVLTRVAYEDRRRAA